MSQNCHEPLIREGTSNLLDTHTVSHLRKPVWRPGNCASAWNREDDLVQRRHLIVEATRPIRGWLNSESLNGLMIALVFVCSGRVLTWR